MGRHSLGRLLAILLVTVPFGCRGARSQTYHDDPFASSRSTRSTRLSGSSRLGNSRAPATTKLGAEAAPPRSMFDEDEQPILQPKSSSSKRPGSPRTGGEPAENADAVTTAEHRTAAPRATHESDNPMDHAPDYSWVQGRLEYSALSGGIWKVRYAPLSEDDAHGGSVVLESIPANADFQQGDTVYVEGQLTAATDRRTLRNPTYYVQHMVRVQPSGHSSATGAGSRSAN